jgi:hypothetical protein
MRTDPPAHEIAMAPWPEQHLRAQSLQALYLLDGRQRPDHPHHGTYTGLHQQRLDRMREALGREPTAEEIDLDNHRLTAPVPF